MVARVSGWGGGTVGAGDEVALVVDGGGVVDGGVWVLGGAALGVVHAATASAQAARAATRSGSIS